MLDFHVYGIMGVLNDSPVEHGSVRLRPAAIQYIRDVKLNEHIITHQPQLQRPMSQLVSELKQLP
jgi:hypothetical protein